MGRLGFSLPEENVAERYRQMLIRSEKEKEAARFLNAYDDACREFAMRKEYTG